MSAPQLLVRTERYTEGVVVDRDGTIYFSMTGVGTISRIAPGENAATVWAHVPAPNGHAIDRDGSHVVLASVGAILRLDASGRTTDVIATVVDGRWLVYPNGVSYDAERGGFYVTDSGYKATPKTVPTDPQGRVYRIEADGRTHCVADGIAYANGIALSHDGRELYVGESVTRCIWTYDVRTDGTLGARTLLAKTPNEAGTTTVPDGITVGPKERLHVAHYGAREILVYERDGTFVTRIEAGNRATSHLAFAPSGECAYVSGGIETESGAGAIFELALPTEPS